MQEHACNCAKHFQIETRGIAMTSRERALVAVPRGNYGTIPVHFVSGASGGNFWRATYCTRALLIMIIMHAYDDRWFCIKWTKIIFDLHFLLEAMKLSPWNFGYVIAAYRTFYGSICVAELLITFDLGLFLQCTLLEIHCGEVHSSYN
jgi:hypothetical protein